MPTSSRIVSLATTHGQNAVKRPLAQDRRIPKTAAGSAGGKILGMTGEFPPPAPLSPRFDSEPIRQKRLRFAGRCGQSADVSHHPNGGVYEPDETTTMHPIFAERKLASVYDLTSDSSRERQT
jgi:hypothetical protein